jgi:hypothetical protein
MNVQNNWPTFDDVLTAYQHCRVGKPASVQQSRFELKVSENILNLVSDIHKRKYKPGQATCFVVTHPKPREIFAANYQDRIVHHLIVSRLEPIWEPKFINTSFACRTGKGTHGALQNLKAQVRKISRGGKLPVFVLQLDLAAFFVSIHRPTLKDLFLKDLNPRAEQLRWLIETYMNHDPRQNVRMLCTPAVHASIPKEKSWFNRAPDDGLPIGNLTSQFGANVYLNDLDHWIMRTLKPMGYLRYMDDLTLLHSDRSFLEPLEKPINDWLKKYRFMELNPKKSSLSDLRDGINYLGYRVVQTDSPKNPARLRSPPIRNWDFIADLRALEKKGLPEQSKPHHFAIAPNYKAQRERLASINSRLGLFKH